MLATCSRRAEDSPALPSPKRQHVLDAVGFADQKLFRLLQLVTSRDDGAHRFRPAFHENPEIVNGVIESIASGIYRPEQHLVLQHHVSHDKLAVDADLRQRKAWNA